MREDEDLQPSSFRYYRASSRVMFAALQLSRLFQKANFNPNQPRSPRGTREGGRWTRQGSGSEPSVADDRSPPIRLGDENDALEVPRRPPRTAMERNAAAKRVAVWLLRSGVRMGIRLSPIGRVLDTATWLYEYAPYIDAYLDAPKSLAELRGAVADPRRGYERHHIVEEDAARRDGLEENLIQSPGNLVLISAWRPRQITGWYMTRNPDFGGVSPRDYLRGRSWNERLRIGLIALAEHGVLEP